MNILLSTKEGSLPKADAEKLVKDLEAMGYKVAHGHMRATSDIRGIYVQVLPDPPKETKVPE